MRGSNQVRLCRIWKWLHVIDLQYQFKWRLINIVYFFETPGRKYLIAFLLGDSSDSALRDCFLPFGRGPRVCIGAKFAQVEMKIVLAKILRTFHFKFDTHASAGDLGSVLMMTLKPHPPPILEIELVDKPRQPSR